MANTGIELMPPSTYRVYFHEKKAYKLIVEDAPEGNGYTVDLRSEKDSDKKKLVENAGNVLFAYARSLREAMNTMAR